MLVYVHTKLKYSISKRVINSHNPENHSQSSEL